MNKLWQIRESAPQDFLDKFPEISNTALQLLYNRGFKEQGEINEFLNPDYEKDIHDPFLFQDMHKAVARIVKAKEIGEKVVIFGDYDADGVTSTALLSRLFDLLGLNFSIYIPHREKEGYGLNHQAIEELKNNGVSLIITVDCGISNQEEIEWASAHDIDVIVTDHHHAPAELPDKAYAIINPQVQTDNYPFSELSGVGVAFKFAQAILKSADKFTYLDKEMNLEAFEKWLLDLVAVGTVADCSPLLGENRTLIKYGLIVLNKTKNPGLTELINNIRSNLGELDTFSISYQIAPRLNAAGRIDHANTAYELLITENIQEAKDITAQLNQNNSSRQAITEKIFTAVKKQIEESFINGKKGNILFAVGDNWPMGIVGLVAGKAVDFYRRPCLVMTRIKGDGISGSGRSIPEFNIIEALEGAREYVVHFGGHDQACGLSLKNEEYFEKFKQKMIEIADRELGGKDLLPVLEIDAEAALEEVNWGFFEELAQFKPFGEGNTEPLFLSRGLKVVSVDRIGKDGDHMRLMVSHKTNIVRKTIGFCFGNADKKGEDWCAKLKIGDEVDMVFEVGVNEWNGNRELQLKIVDLKLSNTE